MSNQLSHVTAALMMEPWLITEARLNALVEIVEVHLAGGKIPAIEKSKDDAPWTQAGIDFIPVFGTIAPKIGLMENLSGGTSISDLRDAFATALENPDSNCIAFLFDTPGGHVKGGFEFADEIASMRSKTQKTVLAHAEGQCCSLGYLLASQCDQISMTVGSEVGSIGVISTITNRDRQLRNDGVEKTVLRSSPLKGIGADALTGPQIEHLQARIGEWNKLFQLYVGRAREGVDFSALDSAAVLPAQSTNEKLPSAVDFGLVDRVTTRDALIATHVKKSI